MIGKGLSRPIPGSGIDIERFEQAIAAGPSPAETRRTLGLETLAIARRSISTLTKNQGIGDLYRIYTIAKRDGIEFNLAAIPPTVRSPGDEPFDQAYMTSLFELGYDLGRSDHPRLKAPPGMENTELGSASNTPR